MSSPRLKQTLQRLIDRQDLAADEVEGLFGSIMDGVLEAPQVAALLVALRMKGESGHEVAAAARAMRRRARRVPLAAPEAAVDTCGTGGDGADTINISTAAALVVAAAGVPVAKHGNRSVSSRCGSADVLESAGVRLDLEPSSLGRLVDEVGVGFLFAPPLHPAMAAVMPVRRSMAVRTVFNLLGPLSNPAGVTRQVVGVWGREVQDLMAAALADLGAVHALVVHSDDGLDELSVSAPTRLIEVREGQVVDDRSLDPRDLGIEAQDLESLRGGEVDFNLERLRAVLAGKERSAATEAVALNAAAALHVSAEGVKLRAALDRSREVVASGAALERLETLARASQQSGDRG
jgi:anthranilate phosphoribosyltransferase